MVTHILNEAIIGFSYLMYCHSDRQSLPKNNKDFFMNYNGITYSNEEILYYVDINAKSSLVPHIGCKRILFGTYLTFISK